MKLLFIAFAFLFSNTTLANDNIYISDQNALSLYKALVNIGVQVDYAPAYNRIALTEITCTTSSSFSSGTVSNCRVSSAGNSFTVTDQSAFILTKILVASGASEIVIPSLQTVQITNLDCLMWKGLGAETNTNCSFK